MMISKDNMWESHKYFAALIRRNMIGLTKGVKTNI